VEKPDLNLIHQELWHILARVCLRSNGKVYVAYNLNCRMDAEGLNQRSQVQKWSYLRNGTR